MRLFWAVRSRQLAFLHVQALIVSSIYSYWLVNKYCGSQIPLMFFPHWVSSLKYLVLWCAFMLSLLFLFTALFLVYRYIDLGCKVINKFKYSFNQLDTDSPPLSVSLGLSLNLTPMIKPSNWLGQLIEWTYVVTNSLTSGSARPRRVYLFTSGFRWLMLSIADCLS